MSDAVLDNTLFLAVLLSRPFLGLETKTETWTKISSALESRDHGLEITTLVPGHLFVKNKIGL